MTDEHLPHLPFIPQVQPYNHLAKQILARIEWRGPERLGIELTDTAQRFFVAETLPRVVSLVGGEGLEPPTSSV